MKKLLPIIIALIGLGGGVAAGAVMKPVEEHVVGEHAGDGHGEMADAGHGDGHGDKSLKNEKDAEDLIYVGLEKPFFVPVIRHGRTNTLVRLDIHLEVPEDMKEDVAKHDPKLRDAFLRTVMNFSYEDGFSRVQGGEGFAILRDDLLISAREILGSSVKAVLIGEILTRDT